MVLSENPDGSKSVTITKLRKAVLSTGKPAYYIAARAGIHHSQMSLYLAGKKDLKVEHLANLTEILDLPADELIGSEVYNVTTEGKITREQV